MSYTINCVQCGATFLSRSLLARYCSEKCKRKKYEDKRPPKESAVCIICGTTFLKHVSIQRLCGAPECKQQYARDKVKKSNQAFAYTREFYIFERDNFTCAYCGKTSYADGVKLHVDHVISKAMGGQSTTGNLITSCLTCNVTKKAMVLACTNSILEVISKRNLARGIPNDTRLLLSGESNKNETAPET